MIYILRNYLEINLKSKVYFKIINLLKLRLKWH